MLQGALTGVSEVEHLCDEPVVMAETDDISSTVVLQIQNAIRHNADVGIRPASIPIYLQYASFLC